MRGRAQGPLGLESRVLPLPRPDVGSGTRAAPQSVPGDANPSSRLQASWGADIPGGSGQAPRRRDPGSQGTGSGPSGRHRPGGPGPPRLLFICRLSPQRTARCRC